MPARAELQVPIPRKFAGLLEPHRYKAMHGGRGGAKSHSVAGALVGQGYIRPLRIGCFREIQKSLATSVKQLLDDKIDQMGLRNFYRSTDRGIFGANGTQFLFAGLRTNPDSVKSTEALDIAWVEEADRCSQTSLDILTPTLRKPKSELWFTWNRRATTDPVDSLFLGGRPPPDSWVQQVNWRDNPWFPEVLEQEMLWMRDRDRDKWLHVWEGEPLQRSEARVFNNWEVDDLDDEVPEDCEARFGADWGFATDPTVLVKIYRWGRTVYIAREAYRVRCEIDDTPALFAGSDPRGEDDARWQNRWSHPGIEGVLDGTITADSARPETVAYMRARGFHIRSAIKGPRSVEEGVEFLKSHDVVVHPSCTHTQDELATYSYKVDPLTDEVLPQLADRDNHVVDAARYALEQEMKAARRGGSGVAMFSEAVPLR